uniref:Uncharacterized protein n=1 Tax=Physcomitrium patens TaxID=3218 RepID=A0A2K1IR02_PHYPA|nr:hypothetical protein PHYPA_025826 [Physcomitrium patens]
MEPQKLSVQGANLIYAVSIENLLSKLYLSILVVTQGGTRTTPLELREEEVEDVESPFSLEESLQFQEFNKTTKETTKEVQFEDVYEMELSHHDEFQFVNNNDFQASLQSKTKAKKSKVNNPADPYDLWKDLTYVKVNISFGQLIQLMPLLQK